MLFIRNGERQTGKTEVIIEQGVGSDNEINSAGFKIFCNQAFFLCRRGAGQKSNTETERFQKAAERSKMLLCENFGRGHESGGKAGAKALPDERGGHQRLSASHISLKQAAHPHTGGHIRSSLFHSTALSYSWLKGECSIEFRKIRFYQSNTSPVLFLSAAQGTGEEEKLLENKTASGSIQRSRLRRKMNILIGLPGIDQVISFPNILRKKLRQMPAADIQPLTDTLPQGALLQAAAESIHRNDMSGDGHAVLKLIFRLKHRIRHTASGTPNLHFPIEPETRSTMNLVLDIALIEKSNGYRRTVIIGTKPNQIEAAADPGEMRVIGNNDRNADRFSVLNQCDWLYGSSILITPWKEEKKVPYRGDAQPNQGLRAFLPYPVKVADGGGQVCPDGIRLHAIPS